MRFVFFLFALTALGAASPRRLPLDAANDPAVERPLRRNASGPAVLRAQILLDRARFSSGELDASYGNNLEQAVTAFREAHGLPPQREATGGRNRFFL